MKRRLVVVLTALAAVAATASPANGAGAQVVSSRSSSAFAYFATSDGCLQTETYVSAVKAVNGGTQVSENGPLTFATVSIFRQDVCTGAFLEASSGLVSLQRGEFEIDRHLEEARLETTVTVTDELTGASYPVAVDLVFAGTGTSHEIAWHDVYFTPGWPFSGSRCVNHGTGTQVFGQATGRVMAGTTNLAAGASQFADLVNFEGRWQHIRNLETWC